MIAQPDILAAPSYDEHLERCCHVLKGETGTAGAAVEQRTLCGLVVRRRAHRIGDPSAFTCPTCQRPRCPDCVHRYERGQR